MRFEPHKIDSINSQNRPAYAMGCSGVDSEEGEEHEIRVPVFYSNSGRLAVWGACDIWVDIKYCRFVRQIGDSKMCKVKIATVIAVRFCISRLGLVTPQTDSLI